MVYYILHKLNINIISLTKTWGIKWFSDKLCSKNVNIRECCWPVVSSYGAHSIFVSYACHSTPLKQARVPSLALRACFCIWGPFCKDPIMTWLEYHITSQNYTFCGSGILPFFSHEQLLLLSCFMFLCFAQLSLVCTRLLPTLLTLITF